MQIQVGNVKFTWSFHLREVFSWDENTIFQHCMNSSKVLKIDNNRFFKHITWFAYTCLQQN